MRGLFRLVAAALVSGAMAACGGGGGSAGTNPNAPAAPSTPTTPTTPVVQVASMDVFTSSTSVASAAGSTISFTVVPKDANNQALPGQPITFAADSGSLNGTLPTPSTGSKGEPVTGVTLSPGADRANRSIKVTVTSGGLSREVVVPVTGTTLTLSGEGFVPQGQTQVYTARALDSAGQPVPGASLSIASARGAGIAPATATTSNSGQATFTYSATLAGTDTLTVTGLGTRATAPVSVSADEFRFIAPTAGSAVNVGAGGQAVTVQFMQGGAPVPAGTAVNFSTTRGTVTPAATVTNGAGQATTNVASTSAGPATVLAQTATGQVTLALNFVATVPAAVALQANPGAVPPNPAGTNQNSVVLTATVRDAAGNPVANRTVNFSATADPSSGTITPGSAITDASGNASVTFIPGASTTANNGVVLRATDALSGLSGTTNLTVNSQAVFISISTSNEIRNLNPATYLKDFAVTVTDINGAPVGSKVVSLEVYPVSFTKGRLVRGTTVWDYDIPSLTTCLNEDVDRDGILDAGEDRSTDGQLTPGNPAALSASTVTTAANGVATFDLQYGENFANWVTVLITAKTAVGGTESVKTQLYALSPSSADMVATTTPASAVSPFGTGTCTQPN
jgi:hypothetical protein